MRTITFENHAYVIKDNGTVRGCCSSKAKAEEIFKEASVDDVLTPLTTNYIPYKSATMLENSPFFIEIAKKVLRLAIGIAPTTTPIDEIQMWAADIVAGNTAPHFRTELGNIIKLFTGAAIADAIDAATVITQLNLLLARMRANGLIAT